MPGCSVRKAAVNQLANALAAGGDTFASDDDPELVAADVREHRVSRDAARRDYAVVLAADGSVDHGATRRAREDRR